MKFRFTPDRLGVNAVSVSAHKIGGIKGTGALYVDKASVVSKQLSPRALGGGQEDAYRSGTENVAGIAAFGEAVAEAMDSFAERTRRTEELRAVLENELRGTELVMNLPDNAVSGILSVTIPKIKSETAVNELSRNGFCISAGSACSSHGHGASSALLGFGLSESEADSTVRLSLCHLNTEDEIRELCGLLVRVMAEKQGLRTGMR